MGLEYDLGPTPCIPIATEHDFWVKVAEWKWETLIKKFRCHMTSLVRVVLYNPQSFTMPAPHAFMLISAESGRA